MRAADIILKKRGTFILNDNGEKLLTGNTSLTKEEIKFIVEGYVSGNIPDYQISPLLMAIYFNGMTFEETGFLTECMLNSGKVINLHGLEAQGLTGPFVDKHSTGGVGDKISLLLAPAAACCGLQIPMMSGRALGHTGGTLDKLESIEGYKTQLSIDVFKNLIAKNGYAMTGQTKEIVPADRLLYALRDVTGTVESVPLITASILSKKVAEGADALVFDVKCGSGAFMKSINDAKMLASSLVKTAAVMEKKASALITDMETPLGLKIGNFLEIEETIDCLKNNGPADVMEETCALGAKMILLGGKAKNSSEAFKIFKEALTSGKAFEKFLENVEAQGGNVQNLLNSLGRYRSKYKSSLKAVNSGYIFIDAYKAGIASVVLGAGRSKTSDAVCPAAGIILNTVSGTYVNKGDLIMDFYGKNSSCLEEAQAILEQAVSYSEEPQKKSPLILQEIN